ncbi:MAG: TrlF family AAA-like ATPase [Elusimicrobiota bacterium]
MNCFQNGSIWLKADFHLHTKADKEFIFKGEENSFVSSYITALKKSDIKMGVITNHNKFDLGEFKALKDKANKEEIYLLPGVELSINDGANGIHTLIIYDYEAWIKNGTNFIEQFLNAAFEGIGDKDNKNTRCKYNLNALFEKIEDHRKCGRDSFCIMAHVEQKNGFVNELDGGRISQLAMDKLFQQNVLGFQKLRSADVLKNLAQWFKTMESIPSCLEGSDCKSIEEVGKLGIQLDTKGRKNDKLTFLKIGDCNFEAVKYALLDKAGRVKADTKPEITNSHIKSIVFTGGLLGGVECHFSPELNSFIGIRGSGKSSIIEVIRYALDIRLGKKAIDQDYKKGLIDYVLKSGGKVSITIVDKLKEEYRIDKIYGQQSDIYKNGKPIKASLNAFFQSPIYFGQKDLSNKDIDFESDLIQKLIGDKVNEINVNINVKIKEIISNVSELKKTSDLDESKNEIVAQIEDFEHKLIVFKKKGIEDKLHQQNQYEIDIAKLEKDKELIDEISNDLNRVTEDNTETITKIVFETDGNKDVFKEAESTFTQFKNEFSKISKISSKMTDLSAQYEKIIIKLKDRKEALKEEFAKIKREINIPNLKADDYLKYKKKIHELTASLKEIGKTQEKRKVILATLDKLLTDLNSLWHEEYQILDDEIKRLNAVNSTLSIGIEFKGRVDCLLDKLKTCFKGSGITEPKYQNLTKRYKDFIEIYRNRNKLNKILSENQVVEFNNIFDKNLDDLLTFKVGNKFIIKYKNKMLAHHSLGQRASALILFLLAQKENDVLIIDQPEDDLDNQTIYEEVIKELKSLKGKMQFIFATHNANIPVLGDSEKIMACKYSEEKISINSGSIDNRNIQKDIVSIMEGGEEAFNKRKDIYTLWKV